MHRYSERSHFWERRTMHKVRSWTPQQHRRLIRGRWPMYPIWEGSKVHLLNSAGSYLIIWGNESGATWLTRIVLSSDKSYIWAHYSPPWDDFDGMRWCQIWKCRYRHCHTGILMLGRFRELQEVNAPSQNWGTKCVSCLVAATLILLRDEFLSFGFTTSIFFDWMNRCLLIIAAEAIDSWFIILSNFSLHAGIEFFVLFPGRSNQIAMRRCTYFHGFWICGVLAFAKLVEVHQTCLSTKISRKWIWYIVFHGMTQGVWFNLLTSGWGPLKHRQNKCWILHSPSARGFERKGYSRWKSTNIHRALSLVSTRASGMALESFEISEHLETVICLPFQIWDWNFSMATRHESWAFRSFARL